jgi:hypothetical protein
MRRTRNRRKSEPDHRPGKSKAPRGRATVRLAKSADVAVLNVLRKAGRPLRLDELQAGFSRSGALEAEEVLADLVRRAESALRQSTELSAEALARAEALHLKILT